MKFRTFRSLFLFSLVLAVAPWLSTTGLSAEKEPLRDITPRDPAVAEPLAPADKSAASDHAAIVQSEANPVEKEKPDDAKVAADESGDGKKISPEPEVESKETKPITKEKKTKRLRNIGAQGHRHSSGNPRVSILSDSTLEAGGEADAVISVLGSSTSAGTVHEAVVSVLGSSTSSGEVGEAVVSVFGNTRITGGSVGEVAVAVLGKVYVNGEVRGDVVAVLGDLELGPDAEVRGDLICVGGNVIRDPKAILHGHVQNVAFGGHHFVFDGLAAWVNKCLFYARPLAFGAHLMWAWWIALAYLGVYLLVALVAPGVVTKCVQTLEERPGKSILAGVLALLLTPVVYVLLALTVFIVIGVALIPLFTLGLFFAGLFGKVVMLAWLGRRITKVFEEGDSRPVFSVLVGGVVVLLLYTVPVLGFVVYKLMGVLGLGVVIYTLLLSIKSNRPAFVPVRSVPLPVPPVLETPGSMPGVTQLPPVISSATLPRAGFWLRFGAALLDVVMVGVLFGMLKGVFGWFFRDGGSFPLWFAIYNVVMWGTKGTTIGGIICGLKVVRIDDRPIDWGVAIVRCLGAFLSLVVAGLGFIWVGFDDEKQSWHDKIAGTTIVRVPKGTSLL